MTFILEMRQLFLECQNVWNVWNVWNVFLRYVDELQCTDFIRLKKRDLAS